MIEVARPPAWVGVPSEEVALSGVGETSPRVRVVATRPVGEEGLETAGGRWLVETVGFAVELLGSEDLAS
jgi:hypothetical protein